MFVKMVNMNSIMLLLVQFVIPVTVLVLPVLILMPMITVLNVQLVLSSTGELKTQLLMNHTVLVYKLVQKVSSKMLTLPQPNVLHVTPHVVVALLMLPLVLVVLKVSISVETTVLTHVLLDIGLILPT